MPTQRGARAATPGRKAKEPKDRLIDAALSLAAEEGWRRLTLAEIAATAGVPLAETATLFRSKYGIIGAYRRRIDQAVLAGPAPSINDSPRDRLFDVLMRRFEALKADRIALRTIARDSLGDPAMLRLLPGVMSAMGWMLEAAGLPSTGYRGHFARRAVAAIYLSVLPAFFRDDSSDLGSTMAALDRRLKQLDSLAGTLAPILAGRGREKS